MTPLETFMLPGRYLMELFFTGYLYQIDPTFVMVIAGVISWLIWASLFRAAFAITKKLLGFGPRVPF